MTICTHLRAFLFGDVVGEEMRLNELGEIAEWTWRDLPKRVAHVELDAFVIMPNHVHGIIFITDVGAIRGVGAIHELPLRTDHQLRWKRRQMLLPKIIGRFKMNAAKGINRIRQTPGATVWQRNYHEHIIRNDESLNRIREYIVNNPSQWAFDRENPDAMPSPM